MELNRKWYEDYAKAVLEMRQSQRNFFKTHSQFDLKKSIELEKKVDNLSKELPVNIFKSVDNTLFK